MRQGSQGQLDNVLQSQPPLSAGARFCGGLTAALLSLSIVGLPYIVAKWILVRRGEVAIVEWRNGQVRVLPMGWHIIETLGCKVRRAKVTDNVIQRASLAVCAIFLPAPTHHRHSSCLTALLRFAEGSLSVIRVLPGQYGLGLINGHPIVLLPGRHLINDPLFTFRYDTRGRLKLGLWYMHVRRAFDIALGLLFSASPVAQCP
jgi:hypothetical protein